MLADLVTALLVYLVLLVLYLLLFHFFTIRARVRAMLLCGLLVAFLVLPLHEAGVRLATTLVLSPRYQAGLLAALGFSACYYVYLQLFAALEGSLTVRILCHFKQAHEGKLTLPQLEQLYPLAQVVRGKLELMIRDRWLSQLPGQKAYRLQTKGLFMARVFLIVKSFLRWGNGG